MDGVVSSFQMSERHIELKEGEMQETLSMVNRRV